MVCSNNQPIVYVSKQSNCGMQKTLQGYTCISKHFKVFLNLRSYLATKTWILITSLNWLYIPGNRPYPQLRHKIKMAQRVWVVCTGMTGNLWRELHFEIAIMKNAGFDSGETY